MKYNNIKYLTVVFSFLILIGFSAGFDFDYENTISYLEEEEGITSDEPDVETASPSSGTTLIYHGEGSIEDIDIFETSESITMTTGQEGTCGLAELVVESNEGVPVFSEGMVNSYEGQIGENVGTSGGIILAPFGHEWRTIESSGEFNEDVESLDYEIGEVLELTGADDDYWFYNIVLGDESSNCGDQGTGKEISLTGVSPGSCTEFRDNNEALDYAGSDGQISSTNMQEAYSDFEDQEIDRETLFDVYYAWSYGCRNDVDIDDLTLDMSPEEVEEDDNFDLEIEVYDDGEPVTGLEVDLRGEVRVDGHFEEFIDEDVEMPVDDTESVSEEAGSEVDFTVAAEGFDDLLVDSSQYTVVEDTGSSLSCSEVNDADSVIYFDQEDRGTITAGDYSSAESSYENDRISSEVFELVEYAYENNCDIEEDTEVRDVVISDISYGDNTVSVNAWNNEDDEFFVGNLWIRPVDADVNWEGKRETVRILPDGVSTLNIDDIPEGTYDVRLSAWNGVYWGEGTTVDESTDVNFGESSSSSHSLDIDKDSVTLGERFEIQVRDENTNEDVELEGEARVYVDREEIDRVSQEIETTNETLRENDLEPEMMQSLEENGLFHLTYEFRPEISDQVLSENLRVERPPETAEIELSEGWNMVSAPGRFDVDELGAACRLGSIQGQTYWTFENGEWNEPESLGPLQGMYVYSETVCDAEVEYEEENPDSLELGSGWNLISTGVEEATLNELNDGSCGFQPFQGSEVWSFHDGEWETGDLNDQISPDVGFMVQLESSCTIDLSTEPPTPTGLFYGGEN